MEPFRLRRQSNPWKKIEEGYRYRTPFQRLPRMVAEPREIRWILVGLLLTLAAVVAATFYWVSERRKDKHKSFSDWCETQYYNRYGREKGSTRRRAKATGDVFLKGLSNGGR